MTCYNFWHILEDSTLKTIESIHYVQGMVKNNNYFSTLNYVSEKYSDYQLTFCLHFFNVKKSYKIYLKTTTLNPRVLNVLHTYVLTLNNMLVWRHRVPLIAGIFYCLSSPHHN